MDIKVLFEDSDILIVSKPAGVVSNRAVTVKEMTMQDWIYERYKDYWDSLGTQSESEAYFVERLGLVHRLDKETSGVMIFARSLDAFIRLLEMFKSREVEKSYIALTHGFWQTREGVIEIPIGRIRSNRKKFGIRPDGRVSVTRYRVIESYTNYNFPQHLNVDVRGYSGMSLVEFMPKTGRTHQIRVHSNHLGHAIVGDYLYAGRKRAKQDRKWSIRLMLHAARLSFSHPVTNRMMDISDEPDWIIKVIKQYLS